MDLRDPKNQILIIAVIGFIVLIYIWYAKFFTSYSVELAQKKLQHEELRTDLFNVKQKAKTFESLQEEYNNLESRYEKVKLWLPEVKEDEAFLAQLHIAAQLTNSTIVSVTPQGITAMEFYNANSYLVELQATYHNLGDFFAKVVNFPFIVNISDVQLKAREDVAGILAGVEQRHSEQTVKATFKLTSYNSHSGVQSATGSQTQGGQTQ